MFLNEAVSKRILELCAERKIAINKLATLAGLKQSTIFSIVKCEVSSPNLKTLHFICFALGIDFRVFFNSPLFNDLED